MQVANDAAREGAIPRIQLTLWMLLAIGIFNYIDRQIVAVLAEPIRHDLGLSDTQLGLMTGLAFALFYAVLGIPIARYADRPHTNRVGLISICLALWSGMTAVCGLAQNFVQLLLARIGVGVGEAGCTPAAMSLIADSVDKEKRASALAFYGLSGPIGGLFGVMLGGILADQFGWRYAFMVVGIPGIILALLFWWLAPEPRRHRPVPAEVATAPRTSLAEAWAVIRQSKSLVPILIGMAFIAFLSYGKGIWAAVFFIRVHGITPTEYGLFYGLAAGISGAIGTWLSGKLADRYGKRDPKYYMLIPAVALIATVPLFLLGYTASDWRLAIAFLFLPNLILMLYYGPGFLCLQNLVAPQMKAMVISIQLFVSNLFGLGLGPLGFGMVSDLLKPVAGIDSVRWVLCGGACLGIIPAYFFWRASKHLAAELRND